MARALYVGSFILLAVAVSGACTATVTEECLAGSCLPAEAENIPVAPDEPPLPCDIDLCDHTVVPAPPGQVPCEVQAIMSQKCWRCHNDPLPEDPSAGPPQIVPGPFSLVTLDQIYSEYSTDKPKWVRMQEVLDTDFMPLKAPFLTVTEKQTMFKWLCGCAVPEPEGTVCE